MSAFDPKTTCHDCGNQPQHPDSPCPYCRQCAEKSGYRSSFFIELDIDVIRRELGEMWLRKLRGLAE